MATLKRKMRCIVCPEGCNMELEYESGKKNIIFLEGYKCKRGIKFAEDEIKNPLRTLTTTVAIDSRTSNRLPVRSSIPVPKEKMLSMIRLVRKLKINAPVTMGDIIVHDIMGTGADIIASSSVKD